MDVQSISTIIVCCIFFSEESEIGVIFPEVVEFV